MYKVDYPPPLGKWKGREKRREKERGEERQEETAKGKGKNGKGNGKGWEGLIFFPRERLDFGEEN